MKSGFSEFSYGFAFTYGLLNDLPGIESAPIFPSLIEEGRKGYDVKLDFPGLPVFYQFKLSDYLVRHTAKYKSLYGRPYFRFDITPLNRSPQHNLLKALSDNGEPDVYYAAPLFITTQDCNSAFLANRVSFRSIWIPLCKLPYLRDYESHCITFTSSKSFRWHTTGGEQIIGDFSGEHMIARFRQLFELGNLQEINRNWVMNLRTKLIDILQSRQQTMIPQENYPMLSPQNLSYDFGSIVQGLRDIRYLLTTFFSLELTVLRNVQASV